MKLKINAIGIGLVLLFLGTSGLAQTDNWTSLPAKVTLSYASFGSNNVIRFTPLAGAASYSGEGFYVLGATYLKPLNSRFYLESGLEFSHYNLQIRPNIPPEPPDNPGTSFNTKVVLLGAPIAVRMQLSRHFFAQAGLILDIDLSNNTSIDSQTGLGTTAGLGLNFDVSAGTAVFLNPYLKLHSLLPFAGENYPQRLVESGFKIGISFALTRKQNL
jgi:hypothetical protein